MIERPHGKQVIKKVKNLMCSNAKGDNNNTKTVLLTQLLCMSHCLYGSFPFFLNVKFVFSKHRKIEASQEKLFSLFL